MNSFLTVKQTSHVFQQLVGADWAVVMPINKSGAYLIDSFELTFIRCFGRGGDFDNIFEVCEQLFLNRFTQAVVVVVLEFLPFA